MGKDRSSPPNKQNRRRSSASLPIWLLACQSTALCRMCLVDNQNQTNGSFFVNLVKSLGADDYLAPISMLLVDRITAKASRSGSSTAQMMELPLGVAAAFDVDTRLEVVFEVIAEVSRLVDDVTRDDSAAFLANP